MAELVTLTEDGPLGTAGTQVWVDDASQAQTPEGWVNPNAKPAKGKTAAQAPAADPPADPPAEPAADAPAGDQPS